MSGFFLMHRGWRDNPLFGGEFSRSDAWVWLIENAAWKPTRVRIKGDTVELNRGELSYSVRFLAETWGWSKSRVDRFLADLRDEGMIETRSKIGTPREKKAGQGQSIIRVCNYGKYQDQGNPPRDNSGTTSGTTAGQQRDKEEQGNKGTIEEEPSGSSSPPTPHHVRGKDWPEIPEWIPVEPWNGFIDMRKRKRANPTAHAVRLLIAKLDQLRTAGNDPGSVLDQSTERNWTGLFELKDDHHGTGTGNAPRDHRDGFDRALDRVIAGGSC